MKFTASKTLHPSVGLIITLAIAAPSTVNAVELYDTFKGNKIREQTGRLPGKHLDPALWDAWQSRAALDVTRTIAGGKAILKSVTYGNPTTNDGRSNGRSVLAFPEVVGALVTEIEATVQTRSMVLTSCDENTTSNGRLLSPRIGGYWFSDGTVPTHDEDLTGSMFASIEARRLNSDDTSANPDDRLNRNLLRVVGQVFHCGDEDCLTGTTIAFEELGVMRRGHRRKMRIRWDEAGNQFVFQFHRDPEVAISYDPNLNQTTPPRFWKRIAHRGQPQNCDLTGGGNPARPVIGGEVRIFDVSVNPEAIP